MAFEVEWLDNQPIVVVKMNSANARHMHSAFRCVQSYNAAYDQSFVIYDCRNFDLSFHELEKWLRLQSMGLGGSITDRSTHTLLVGNDNVLQGIVYAFELEEFGGVNVGLYDTINSAMRHAIDGSRIFAAW